MSGSSHSSSPENLEGAIGLGIEAATKQMNSKNYDPDAEPQRRVLGGLLTVPASIEPVVKMLSNWGKLTFSLKAKDAVEIYVEEKFHNPKSAKLAGMAVAGAIATVDEIGGTIADTKEYFHDKAKLHEELATVLKAHDSKWAANNGVIQVAEERTGKKFKNNLTKTAAGLVELLPNAIMLSRGKDAHGKAAHGSGHDDVSFRRAEDYARLKKEIDEHESTFGKMSDSVIKLRKEEIENKYAVKKGKEPAIPDNIIQAVGLPSMTFLASYMRKMVEAKNHKATKDPIAKERIMILSEAMEDAVSPSAVHKVSGMGLEEYIKQIFEQYQKDKGWDEIKAHKLVKDLDANCKIIADALRGGLNPLVLFDLVGDGEIVKDHGKSIVSEEETQIALKKVARLDYPQIIDDSEKPVEKEEHASHKAVVSEETHAKTESKQTSTLSRDSEFESPKARIETHGAKLSGRAASHDTGHGRLAYS